MNRASNLTTLVATAFLAMAPVVRSLADGQNCQAPRESLIGRYDFTPLTELMQTAVDTIPMKGASLLLVRDDDVIYERVFGSYTKDTVVPIASATKWYSGAVIMSLVDEGLIALDDPVSQYLPNWTGVRGTMTIRQMFSHTSGLPGSHACLGNPFITLEQCAGQISEARLLAAPGEQFYYGGPSMQVAGRVAEVASGAPWSTLFRERIASPLKMTGTTYGATLNPRVPGGARSTLPDYGNFLRMILNCGVFQGKRVLSCEAVREMQRDQTFGARLAYSPHPDDRRYGIGVWRDRIDEKDEALQVSSQGAFGFSPWIDLERNLVGVFLVQTQLRSVYLIVDQAQRLIREIIDAGGRPGPPHGVSLKAILQRPC